MLNPPTNILRRRRRPPTAKVRKWLETNGNNPIQKRDSEHFRITATNMLQAALLPYRNRSHEGCTGVVDNRTELHWWIELNS